MPIYQYRCQSCGHELEILQKISEPPPANCPQCQHSDMVKCVTTVAMRLNGKGYYETDEKPQAKQRHIASKEGDSAAKATS